MEIISNERKLMRIAEQRVGFKKHATTYILINLFLWCIWAFTSFVVGDEMEHAWPFYPMIGWGIGLTFHYLNVYRWNEKWVEKEYQQLLKQQELSNHSKSN